MDSEKNYKLNYIRLDSEINETRGNNRDFWVHLKDSIELDNNSEVALVNINFPNLIKNISNSLGKKKLKLQ